MEELRTFLGQSVRVVLSDSRVIEGELHCIDRELNLVINFAHEIHHLEDAMEDPLPESVVTRNVGSAMVPGSHIVKVLVKE